MKKHLELRYTDRLGDEHVYPHCNVDSRQMRSLSTQRHMAERLTTNVSEVTCAKCQKIAARIVAARAALRDRVPAVGWRD